MRTLIYSHHDLFIDTLTPPLTALDHSVLVANTHHQATNCLRLSLPSYVIVDAVSNDALQFCTRISEQHLKKPCPALLVIGADGRWLDATFEHRIHLLPPIDDDAWLMKFTRLIKRLSLPTLATQIHDLTASDDDYLMIKLHRTQEKIRLSDIYFCQSEHKYTKVHHRYGMTLIDDSLSSLLERFEGKLLRIHRHTLVNIQFIRKLQLTDKKHMLTLYHCPQSLEVSRRCVAAVRLSMI